MSLIALSIELLRQLQVASSCFKFSLRNSVDKFSAGHALHSRPTTEDLLVFPVLRLVYIKPYTRLDGLFYKQIIRGTAWHGFHVS
jgi:hypothetical protein